MKKINIALLFTLLFFIVVIFMIRRNYFDRNYEVLPSMIFSVAYNSQSENPNFKDGSTSRSVIAGTIARNMMPLEFNATAEDAIRAGKELTNPFSASEDILTRGAVAFGTFCQPCHGAVGQGDGIVAQRGFPPPPSLMADRALAMKDGQIFHIQTFGQNNMPSMASQISKEDRWKVVHYIRQLQSQKK